jgi:hypothetical protein
MKTQTDWFLTVKNRSAGMGMDQVWDHPTSFERYHLLAEKKWVEHCITGKMGTVFLTGGHCSLPA